MVNIIIIITLVFILLISLGANFFLYFHWKRAIKAPVPTTELQEFLSDLMGGKLGMIAVARVDQSNLLLRSTRGS